MNKVSILHISDIHKGADMSLKTLLDSLIRDRERWEEEGIKHPDYIVLSGDVVQGGATEEIIAGQYVEAESFLSELCKEFLGNDRERMIIVPGNHDLSWPYCDGCMEPVDVTPENIELYLKHKDEDGHFRYGAEHPLSEFLSLMFFNAQLRGKTCQNDQKTG